MADVTPNPSFPFPHWYNPFEIPYNRCFDNASLWRTEEPKVYPATQRRGSSEERKSCDIRRIPFRYTRHISALTLRYDKHVFPTFQTKAQRSFSKDILLGVCVDCVSLKFSSFMLAHLWMATHAQMTCEVGKQCCDDVSHINHNHKTPSEGGEFMIQD